MQYYSIIKAIINYVTNEDISQLNLQKRKMIQHVLYLSTELGVYIGDFVWNITRRGIESNSVSSIIEDCKRKNEDNGDVVVELKETIKNMLNPLRELVSKYKTYESTKEDWLFALATVHYSYSYKAAIKNTEVITKILVRRGFQIHTTEVLNALRELKNHKLINIEKKNKRY